MLRRDFLATLPALATVAAARWRTGGPRRIGISLGANAPNTAALRGLRFGAQEAKRTAALLKQEIGWVERTGSGSLGAVARAGVELIIVLGDAGAAPPGAPPIVRVALHESDASTCGVPEWQLAPSAAQRLEVVRAYLAAHAGSPRELRAVAWHHALEKYGAAQLNQRYRGFTHEEMGESGWLGWFSAKLALEAVLRGSAAAELRRSSFGIDGHKGIALRFEATERRLHQPLYIVDPRSPDVPPLAELTPQAVPEACAVEPVPPPG